MQNKRCVCSAFIKYFLILYFVNAYSVKRSENPREILSRLLRLNNGKEPLVLIVDLDQEHRSSNLDKAMGYERPIDYDYLGDDDKRNHNEEFLPILDLINPTPYTDTSSSSSIEEMTRSALRTAFICFQVDNCVKKCPPKKPYCPTKCQQVFDNLNICKPPTTTTRDPCGSRPKCGKTMPPKWRV